MEIIHQTGNLKLLSRRKTAGAGRGIRHDSGVDRHTFSMGGLHPLWQSFPDGTASVHVAFEKTYTRDSCVGRDTS